MNRRSFLAQSSSAGLLAAFTASSPASAAPVSALNVIDRGARGDGTGDDTAAIQKALDAAAEKGGVVWLPAGRYAVRGTLSVPEGVTLEGVWRGIHSTSQLDKGTTLLAYAGRGNENAMPFISLKSGSALKGVSIFYPEQQITDIRPYPWTIQGKGQLFSVIDVTVVNPYNGIDCGTYWNNCHSLRNVLLGAVNIGVYVDQCTDVGRMENVHIHPIYWMFIPKPFGEGLDKQSDALMNYCRAHLVGFLIGRTDWEYISNSFVIWARVGFHFVKRPSGTANALITQSGSDLGPLAIKVDELQWHCGVAFENCQFMCGLEIGPDNTGPVKLTNCGFFWTQSRVSSGSQLILEGQGTVTLIATQFARWDKAGKGDYCIDARAGSLLMHGCDFMGFNDENRKERTKSPHLRLGKGLSSAAIVGNRFEGGESRILNESKGDVQMVANVSS
ncbi:MAG TPA: glycosyl hydrolase family 28-related protein [Opitutaceae bacterium]|nr:glycosyl hydrolase family 28-related protein [Opitutaceae bacterium]